MLITELKCSQSLAPINSNKLHRIYAAVTNNKPKPIYTHIRKHYNYHLFG